MNTGYNTTASSSSSSTLFPPLNDANSSPPLDNISEGGLLWNNVNTFAIPDDTTDKSDTSSISSPFPALRFNSQTSAAAASAASANTGVESKEDSTAFNISWGGDDKPPVELHPEEKPVEEPKLSRPLPKPRGIRRLPEPEPSADGTIDEDTLKRRKVRKKIAQDKQRHQMTHASKYAEHRCRQKISNEEIHEGGST